MITLGIFNLTRYVFSNHSTGYNINCTYHYLLTNIFNIVLYYFPTYMNFVVLAKNILPVDSISHVLYGYNNTNN